jgi:UDP-N-acetylmuramoylalanine-D-glutamate ligase
MAAAARLAKLGHEVTLLERSERLGGALGTGELDGDLEHAVAAAAAAARAGETVLLAPACASFDQFPNFEARGRAFKELVAARRTSA